MTTRLGDVCFVRSGDKADIVNVAIFAPDPATYARIVDVVTAEAVKKHLGDLVRGRVDRYEVPGVLALNFVLHDALGGGGPATLRSDNLGKTMGGAVLSLPLPD